MKSIKDVAKKAGVSVATASRVLSGKGYSSEASRKKVEAAVKALDYRPNRAARSLRENKTYVLGLVVSDIRNPFFSEIAKSVEDTALKYGYSVLICNTNEDPEREVQCMQLLKDENVAGVMMSPTLAGSKRFPDYLTHQFPVVIFDRKPSGFDVDSILIDNVDSAAQLTQSLVAAGYRNIAGIFGKKSYTAAKRMKGFQNSLASAGLKPVAQVKIPPTEADGDRVAEKLLSAQPDLDAMVCSSALLAIGAYKAIRRSGRRIGFACFDDTSWTEFVNPPATVIRQPTEMIGSTAVELLVKRIEDPSRPVSEICLKGELVDRNINVR
jgi:LacI family fructose operon transcriptional repressor